MMREEKLLASIIRRSIFWMPQLCVPSAWTEHVPFAFWLINVLRPQTVVELGVHNGMSYSALCQAVKTLGLSSRCFGVDTWKGDEQAGYYTEEVFRALSAFNDQHYASFSRLIRSTFNEAVPHFEDGSIDLLHIDGFHTYDAVREDFETWRRKVSGNGIVLFHDINVREGGYGVFRLWDEVRRGRPHFSFLHGHGLGVLGVGERYCEPLRLLFNCENNDQSAAAIRSVFCALGQRARVQLEWPAVERELAVTKRETDVKTNALAEEISRLTGALRERDENIGKLGHTLSKLIGELSERDRRISALNQALSDRVGEVAEREERINALAQQLTAQDEKISALSQQLNDGEDRISTLTQSLANSSNELTATRATVELLRASTSWRLAAPLRWTKQAALPTARLVRNSVKRSRAAAGLRTGQVARIIYRRLPVSHQTRLRIRDVIFSQFGFLLKRTTTYSHWSFQRRRGSASDSAEASAAVKGGSNGSTWRSSYLELSAFSRRVQCERIHGFEPRPVPTIALSEEDAIERAGTLAFSSSRKPKVSIVIPVYGKFRLTIECLCSLVEAKNKVPFEVIIMDDGSKEAAFQRLAQIPGVKYVRNSANLGFVKACNRGIEHAVGDYVVVLNNDVQVTDSWLDHLIAVLAAAPDIGAAGPKIIYPNGRLQEAGVVINRDATSTLVGVAEQSDLPAYNYLREIDYCSGACLMFKKTFFDELGGFDPEFAPSYCEDVDLCLKIRQRGLKIVYVPESVIIHHLSATANSVHKSYKGWMIVRNQQKLAERWQEQIDQLNEVRLIAFYLPQFHPIPENDRWWGKSFTEWSNVAKARPNFVGHQQPILPADLGFYDLRLPKTMITQAALARRYGIHGFCFYYYWFGGKRLLEAPLEQMLATGEPDIPFCLCWANENWTRRWDGGNSEIVMQQNHTEADDFAVIDDVARYMRHPNYIRIQGKPVFAVYQVGIFPDIAATANRWRQRCRDGGLGDIFLVRVDSLDAALQNIDPRNFGFDAAIEFPPHSAGTLVETPPLVNASFQGHVYDYAQLVRTFVRRPLPGYPLFRGVTPRWDNTARRQDHSNVFIGSNPGAYQAWLQAMIEQTRLMHHGDAQIVFVNSWNEWAEGAHLEPDKIFGVGYLQATRDALDAGLLVRGKVTEN